MVLKELVRIVEGEILTGAAELDRHVEGGFGADLMSDVLASEQSDLVLLTGLCNPQVVRTAHMADIPVVVFVRGKMPSAEMIELADQEGILLVSTTHGMFEVCGRLHRAGLVSLETPVS